MKISVVIPAHNEQAFLRRTLKSLKKQTFKLPYEIIVADNNSTDKTAYIAKKHGAIVIKEQKQGYAYACSAGFKAAKGEIIARADADYVLPKKWLEKIWKEFKKDEKLVALGGPIYPLESHWWENLLYFPGQLTWMYLLKLLKQGYLFPNMAVRREIYKRCGGFDTSIEFGEDTNLCLRLEKLGKVKLFPDIYAYTSLRRLRTLGLLNFIIKYGLGNEIAKATGKKPVIGLEIVREVPKQPARPQIPWPYLIAGPSLLLAILLLTLNYWLKLPSPKEYIPKTAQEIKSLRYELGDFTKKLQLPKPTSYPRKSSGLESPPKIIVQ